ncbi:MAG: N-acetylglucosamine-6-phosphate deacetylase [Ruminococcaceae bacterium]|nr:N-acetylglucosamine-6-phosphate deacetylase [Oscillospiraceae bacterium]
MNILFKRAYNRGATLTDGILKVSDGRFDGITHKDGSYDLDLSSYRVFPGFIDMHTHGALGHDSLKVSYDDLNKLSDHYASCGVSTFLVTTSTAPLAQLEHQFNVVSDRIEAGTSGASIGGIYAEGPYLCAKFRGAHAEPLLRTPNIDEAKRLITAGRGNLRVFTVAPELPGAIDMIEYLVQNGVKVSLGHTAATMEEARLGLDAGANILVHTYNAMAGLNHRNVGLLGMGLVRDDAYCEIICDFIHVCPEACKIVLRCKNSDKVILITDSVAPTGMPDGAYNLSDLDCIVKDGIARTVEGALAGSSLRSNRALQNVVETLDVPVETAAKMLTINPATALGLEKEIGALDRGYRAHLTALDENYNVVLTMVDGKIVYDNR